MNNSLEQDTNIKRINLLKMQIEKAKELKKTKINKRELKEIKKGAHKLIINLWLIPVSIILLLTSLISKTVFLEGISFSIMYFIALIPINLIINNIIDYIYRKEINERLELNNFILEKEQEISKLIKYNKSLQVNNNEKQKDYINNIENEKTKDKVYIYSKKR